jgi:hypothetical protein
VVNLVHNAQFQRLVGVFGVGVHADDAFGDALFFGLQRQGTAQQPYANYR